ncbi:MAG: N-acetyltransferase O1 (Establishment of cohesion protein 1) [Sclerophora amabilis]|nr:MAG: N-acetyltransferase O1 (Establishment of cohesion protein 1) [Sclerophora amabilis]
MKTYSRQNRRVVRSEYHDEEQQQQQQQQQQEEPASKRRCVQGGEDLSDTTPLNQQPPGPTLSPSSSSPPPRISPSRRDKTVIFSDTPHAIDSTPPSSPPPLVVLPVPYCTSRRQFHSALLLRRRRLRPKARAEAEGLASRALADITNIAARQQPSRTDVVTPKRLTTKRRRLTQMQIDLGGSVQKACKECGMEYTPSSAEDVALHKKFHQMNVGGVDLGRRLAAYMRMKAVRDPTSGGMTVVRDKEGGGADCYICVVDWRSSLAERNKAKQILEVVNAELSAATPDDSSLWGLAPYRRKSESNSSLVKRENTASSTATDEVDGRRDRFMIFLYIRGDKCVGLCLAERITKAHKVVDDATDATGTTTLETLAAKGSSISISLESYAALLGISRIWTSSSHRRKGIASTLMEHARRLFVYGMEVPKDMMAFSQPTDSGGRLARRWFAELEEWRVYLEN